MVFCNKNSIKGRKNIILILFVTCLICAVCSFGAIMGVHGQANFNGAIINEYYNLGQQVDIPDATLVVDGNTYTVEPKVIYPDGQVLKKNTHKLNQLGKHTVLYQAEVDGKVYAESKDFQVYDYLFSNSVSGQPFKYGTDVQEGVADISGLRFDICQGESLIYNKVIDLNDYEVDDTLIRLEAVPEVSTVRDCTTLYIYLTDAYNPDNIIKIRILRAPDAADPNGVSNEIGYISAVHGSHPYQYLTKEKYYYGKTFRNSLYGRTDKTAPFELRFDYANKRVYSYWDNGVKGKEQLQLVTDMVADYSNDAWQGFTTGECYLSIFAEGYVSSDVSRPFHGMILEIDGKDLTTEESGTFSTHKVVSTNKINVLFNEYESATGVPNAVVGYSYKLFDKEYLSLYGGEKFYTNVYYAYTSNSRYEVPTSNGYFTPDKVGVYTIVYTVVDVFGNVAKTEVDVTAVADDGYGIYVKVPSYENYVEGNVGERVSLVGASDVEVSGNNGSAHIDVIAVHADGDSIVVENDYFVPLKAGKWVITYTAKDYSGRVGKFEYELNVKVSDGVVFTEIKDMPKYLIVNAENNVPELQYIDYNVSPEEKQVKTVYAEKDGVKVADIVSAYFKPTEAGVYDIVYQATSSQNQVSTKRVSVLALDVGYGKKISQWDRTKYFYSENGDIVSTVYNGDGVYLTVKENGKFDFIRPINAVSFSITLSISATEKTASKVNLYLTDVNNEDQQLKISLVNNMGALMLLINDRHELNISGQTFADMKVTVSLNNGVISCGSATFIVRDYLNGTNYNGFESLLADFSMETEVDAGVTGLTTVLIDVISGQAFAKPIRKFDGVAPTIAYSESLLNKLEVGGIVKIPYAKVTDIMSAKTVATLTVIGPDDKVVTDTNGNLLDHVSIEKDYYINLSIAGMYSLVYDYSDDNGNSNSASLVIDAVSRNKPTINISGQTTTVKVGQTFTIANATCEGEFTSCDLYIFVLGPTGNLKPVEMSNQEADYMTFKATEKGVYKVLYMAIDQWGNQALAEYFVTAS